MNHPITSADEGLTVTEAAAVLGVTRQTVSRWIQDGQLPAARFGPYGRVVRIDPADVDKLIQSNRTS